MQYILEPNCSLLPAKPLTLKRNYVDVCATFLISFVPWFVVSPEQGSSLLLKHTGCLRSVIPVV